MLVRLGWQYELSEDRVDVRLHGLRAEHELAADALVREPLRDQLEHLALAGGQLGKRVVPAAAAHQLADDLGVDDGAAPADAAHRLEKLVDVENTVLEQVSKPFGLLAEEIEGMPHLDRLGEQEHRKSSLLGPNLLRDPGSLIGLSRRHAHVDDDYVGVRLAHGLAQLLGVAGLRDDLELRVGQYPSQALPEEDRVVRDYDAHGISATMRVPPAGGLSTRSRPPSASTRSASPRSPEPPF